MPLQKLLPSPLRHALYLAFEPYVIARLPDRQFMVDSIFPRLAAGGARRVLFVGSRRYTRGYPKRFARIGIELWTCDIDPAAAAYGAPGRHRTLDIRKVTGSDFPVAFDAVVFNGVLGYGVDDRPATRAAFQSLAGLLPAGAMMVVGWNTDRISDPLLSTGDLDLFAPLEQALQPSRVTFPGISHVYDFLVRTDRPVEPV